MGLGLLYHFLKRRLAVPRLLDEASWALWRPLPCVDRAFEGSTERLQDVEAVAPWVVAPGVARWCCPRRCCRA